MGEQRHLQISHVIVHFLVTVHDSLDELEVPGGCLLDSPVEVEGVAATSLVVARLHVLELVGDGVLVIPQEVVEAYAERSGLLREEIGIILDHSDLLSDWHEPLRQQLCHHFFKSTIIQGEAGSQEVWLEKSHKVLAEHRVVSLLAGNDELAILRLPLGEELTMVRHLGCSIFHGFWFGIVRMCKLFSFLNKPVVMRIITEDAVVIPRPQNLGQIMRIIRQHESLQLVCLDFLRCLQEQLELDLEKKRVYSNEIWMVHTSFVSLEMMFL